MHVTSIPVNNVNALQSYGSQQPVVTGKQEEAVQESFQKVMGKITDEVTSLQGQTAGCASAGNVAAKKDSMEQGVKLQGTSGDKNRIKDASGQTTGQKSGKSTEAKGRENVREEEKQTIREDGEKLVQDVADEMNMTPEEVEAAMETLGLSAVDLFDPENLKQLLLELSGCNDELSLVTNAELYANLQNLLETVQNSLDALQEELGLSEEEIGALITEMVSTPETDVPETALEDMPQDTLEGSQDYTVTVHRDGETVQVSVKVDDESGDTSKTENVTDMQEPAGQDALKEQSPLEKRGAQGGRQEDRHNAESSASMMQAEKDNAAMVKTDAAVPVNAQTGTYQSTQTQQIMDQIVDYMKVHVKSDMQEMEMQLHPASLGTVHVQITAKAGGITAQFITQNEAVRAAVESQIVTLKEQFEEQGLKVDEVEVSVAAHGQEQQFTREEKDAEREQAAAGKTTRRLNLGELDEEEELEEMEQSDKIAVEMMRANGGTVDYTA